LLAYHTDTVLRALYTLVSYRYLKLIVDLGSEKRQIISGMRPLFDVEEAIGKSVLVVANSAEEVITVI
jgi:methionyl-tRNA synthetase